MNTVFNRCYKLLIKTVFVAIDYKNGFLQNFIKKYTIKKYFIKTILDYTSTFLNRCCRLHIKNRFCWYL
jgi:uncharacterized protein YpiB (UPF0302 family)